LDNTEKTAVGAALLMSVIIAAALMSTIPSTQETTKQPEAEAVNGQADVSEDWEVDKALSEDFTETWRIEYADSSDLALFDRAEFLPKQYFVNVYSTVAPDAEEEVKAAVAKKLGKMTTDIYYLKFRDRVDLNDIRIYANDGSFIDITYQDSRLPIDQ
jgi:hypothetical protein